MKKNTVFRLCGLFIICLILFNNCEPETNNNITENGTPAAADYNFGNLTQIEGSVTAVTITAKPGKSSGARTIYYDGNTAIPQVQGTYAVTFDVAAAPGWNAVSGLFAGILTVNPNDGTTPTAADFNIGNLTQTSGSVTAVTITPKSGKSNGAKTIYYDGNTAIPQAQGEYTVTFDVAASEGWKAATGLSAGTLTVIGNNTGNNTGSSGRKVGFLELARMDIENAHTVYIAPSPVTSGNDFYMITDTGNIQEVTYTYKDEFDNTVTKDEGGNIVIKDKDGIDITNEVEGNVVIPSFTPNDIIVLNDDYFIATGNNNYLINSETGACYKYTDDIPFDFNKHFGRFCGEIIANDRNRNIYFISSSPWSIKKLSIADIDNISITTISAPNDVVLCFGADFDGNIAYYAGELGGSYSVARYRHNNGGYEILPGTGFDFLPTFWTDFDGKFYYQNHEKTIIINSNPFGISDYTELSDSNMKLFKMKNKKRIIMLGRDHITELYNEITNIATLIRFSTFGLSSVKTGISSDNYYYLTGISNGTPRNVFIKIDPLDNSYTTLINGGYDIYKMSVSADDVVTLNAMRMSDGAIVIGEISASGQIKILDATLKQEVIVLERIK